MWIVDPIRAMWWTKFLNFAGDVVLYRCVAITRSCCWALPWAGASLLALDMEPASNVSTGGDLRDVAYIPSANPQNPQFVQLPNKTSGTVHDHLYVCFRPQQAARIGMPCSVAAGGRALIAAPRSLHPGGVNAVALDGHCGFISNDVDPVALARVVAVEDGLVIDIGEVIR